jgi:UDP-N-acetylmuramoyl-L-alanyl-D-glutamate--2,6-diaminopimelate ligase
MLRFIKKIIPEPVFKAFQPAYHLLLAFVGALIYRFPSRKIKIVGITGTKGKTTTAEVVNKILETAGYKTAVASTLRFKIGNKNIQNKFKMTMPGRFFQQKLIRRAVDNRCEWLVLEMTSEGVRQFRHKWIALDALIFTNIAPEHIESHGTFEKYLLAKLELAKSLAKSNKKFKVIVANNDDAHGKDFIKTATQDHVKAYPFSLKDAEPWNTEDRRVAFTFKGRRIESPLKGKFNIYNLLAGATFAQAIEVDAHIIDKAIGELNEVRGRVEYVRLPKEHPLREKQDFDVIVDYAHTIDSQTQLYEAFSNQRKICVLGNTGGGRDKWKRAGMGEVADKYCDEIILTNEDPYDEDPLAIAEDMKKGVKNKPCEIIIDRREAINSAIRRAKTANVILITGKGTDPYIMGPNDTKQKWDDAEVAREELERAFSL